MGRMCAVFLQYNVWFLANEEGIKEWSCLGDTFSRFMHRQKEAARRRMSCQYR